MRRNLLIFYMTVFYATSIFAQPLSYWQSIPDSLYVKGEIIVKLNENSASNQRTSGNPLDVLFPIKTKQVKPLFDLNDARSRTTNHANPHVQEKQRKYGLANMYRISLANVEETASVLDYLNRQEEVEYAEPVYRNFPLYMPNDPHFSGQYNLTVAQVPAAWDITEGSSDVVIGIVDNEFIVSHEDLVNKWYYNNAELYGTPGVDDDMNGYVDDYCGYDFHGRDPDVSPNDTWYTGHGMFVAGVAGAETNNGVGIASVGNKCKLMPLALSGTYANTMEAVIYAAQNGCKVVNMSWGRPWYASRWEQEMFNFLTEAYDVVFVAAAGNTPSYVDFFPATYDNVIAVAASNSADQRAWFSTYSHLIDIIAPGDMVYGTWNTGYNFGGSGTSYAAPFVAGAIGLIRSHFPHLNAKQAAELLRITADASFYSHPANSPFAEQLGYGRINVLRALTELGNSPVVRFHDWNYTSTNGKKIVPNVPIHIRMNFTNYFKATTNLTITLSTTSPYVTIANPTLYVGMLDYLQTIDNHTNPFQVTFSTSTPSNHKAIFRVGFNDGTYQDYQYFYITLDHHNWWNFSSPPFPSPYDLTINYFRVGLDADGRLGRTGTYSQPRGSGIYYKTSPNLVQEAGLIIATDATHVADGLRTTPGNQNDDFTVLDPALIYQYEGNFVSVHSRYEDYSRNTTPIHVEVTQLYTIWYPIEDASYFLIEYDILNKNTHSIPELYVGLFADWDISANDHADWHSTKKFGYVYNHAGNFYVGVLPLNDYVDYYAINVADGSEINNLDLTDGFSDAEKFQAVSSNMLKTQAGGTLGNNVAHVVATKLTNLLPNTSQKVGFVIACANSLTELEETIERSKTYIRSVPAFWSRPTLLEKTAETKTTVSLQWKDNAIDETGFELQRSISPLFDVDVVNLPINVPNTTSYNDTGLQPGTTYYYRIRAKK